MKQRLKVKAGAVQYVLVISVIILIVVFSFISLVFLQSRMQLKSDFFDQTIENCYAAFDLIEKKNLPYNESQEFQFSEYSFEKTSIQKKHWGVFDLAIVQSELKNEKSTKEALLANHTMDRKALRLEENNQPLKLVGNTKIIGDVVLPRRSVSAGNIAGVSYYGEKLIYGTIQNNAQRLPEIRNLEYVRELISQGPQGDFEYFSLEEGMTKHQSFAKETLVFQSPFGTHLDKMNLSGNIVIISDKEITVSSSSKLDHVILIAPNIIIEKGFKGSLQAIASKKLVVLNEVQLLYPSAAIVIDDTNGGDKEKLVIERNADVRGIVLYHNSKQESNYNTQVKIQEGASVTGEVYCNKNLELLGEVNGFVYTSNFVTKKFGGSYMNHLYNAKIDATSISNRYAGLHLDGSVQKVAKWLY